MESCCARASAPMRKRGAERKGDREALIAPALELKREVDRENHSRGEFEFLLFYSRRFLFCLLPYSPLRVVSKLPVDCRFPYVRSKGLCIRVDLPDFPGQGGGLIVILERERSYMRSWAIERVRGLKSSARSLAFVFLRIQRKWWFFPVVLELPAFYKYEWHTCIKSLCHML